MSRFLLSSILVVFFSFGLLACEENSRSTEDYISYAKAYRQQGDINAAIIELKNALKQSPDDVEARWLLGSVYLDSGDGGGAEKEFRRSIDLGMSQEMVAVSLVRAQMLQQDYQGLLEMEIDISTLSAEDQVSLLTLRGDARFELAEFEAADKLYDEALALDAEFPEANLGKARVIANSGRLDKARELVDEILKANEEFASAWSFLGNMEQFADNMPAAEAAYSKALEYQPDRIVDYANRALVRIAQDNLKGAAQDVGAAVRRQQKSQLKMPLVFYAQGRLRSAEKNYARAVEAYDQVLKYAPDYVSARYYLAVAHYRLGSIEQAEQNLARFRSEAPRYVAGHRLYAAIKFSQGEYEVARQELENILSFDPDDSWALAMLADIGVLQSNPEQSIENFRKLVELHPDSESAQLGLALGLMAVDEAAARQVLDEASAQGKSLARSGALVVVSYLKAQQWDEAVAAGQELLKAEPDNWDAYTLLGGAYIGRGDTAKAREMFNKALKLKPGNPNAANNLANLELKAGNAAQARRLYEQVLEHNPGESSSLLALSSLDYQEGRAVEAITGLEDAVDKEPQDLQLKLALANLYLRTGQPSRALDLANAAMVDFETSSQILEVLGDAQIALGQREAASGTFEKLVAMTPHAASSHYRLAKAYAASNQFERSGAQLQKVVELQPDHYAASVMRVRFLRQQNKLAEAAELLKEVDPAYYGRPEYLVEKGWLSMNQGQHAEAVDAFEQAFAIVPSNLLLVELGIAKWNMGDEEGAIAGYQSWLKDNPGDTQILFYLANSYLQMGRDKQAAAAFSELLEKKPDDPMVMNNLAWLLRDSDPKKALKYAEETVKLAPEWGPGLDTKGSILLKQGDAKQAYRLFGQALKYSPDNPDIRYHLAQAAWKLGEKEEAIQILEAILANPALGFESRDDAQALLKVLRG